MKTAVILLYGLYSPERQIYKKFLDEVAEDLKKQNFDTIILCGGYTDPSRMDESEASTVRNYFKEKHGIENVMLEERSINTNQNLEFAAGMISPESKIIVYCDIARKGKVLWMALHFFLHLEPRMIYQLMLSFAEKRDAYTDFEYDRLTVKGVDYSASKEEFLGQTLVSILDVMAVYDKEMENMDLESRKREFGI